MLAPIFGPYLKFYIFYLILGGRFQVWVIEQPQISTAKSRDHRHSPLLRYLFIHCTVLDCFMLHIASLSGRKLLSWL